MKKQLPTVKGARTFYPEDMAFRAWLYGKIRTVSERFGYAEFDGPFLEPIDLYAAKSGEEIVREQAFVFPDRGGEMITLRPELTPSLARMVADRQNLLTFPVRWWSFGPFWRYEKPQKGRSREFFQWNIDLIGAENPQTDAELASIGAACFQELGLTPAEVRILVNNRRLMDSAMLPLGIEGESRKAAFRMIDKKSKMPVPAWRQEMLHQGFTEGQTDGIVALLQNRGLWQESQELCAFFAALEPLGLKDYVEFDPGTIRGLDYYTGTVFEARDPEGQFRAILGGGRYDNLVSDVGGEPLPGVGFAMGDMVVRLVLEKAGKLPTLRPYPAAVLVTTFSAELSGESLACAELLRGAGIAVEWYPAAEKLPKQLKFADAKGVPLAVILGPDEAHAGNVTLKDLRLREQVTVARANLAAEVRLRLAAATQE